MSTTVPISMQEQSSPESPDIISVNQPCKQRLVFITADKGGTGKSTFARVYAHFLIERGIKTLAYDADPRNSQLFRHYDQAFPLGVKRIDLKNEEDADDFIDALATPYPVVMVDLPSGIGNLLETLEEDIQFSNVAMEAGYRTTFVTVLDRGRDCVNSLCTLVEKFEDRVDYVIVKNMHHGHPDQFDQFDTSEIRKRLIKMQSPIICFPDLARGSVDFIDQRSLTYKQARSKKDVEKLSVRSWVGGFLVNAYKGLALASSYLGL